MQNITDQEQTNPQKSLVLVVGAGASYEVNLPLGSELKHQIAKLLDIRYDYHKISGDDQLDHAFRIINAPSNGGDGNINQYLGAAWRIRDAMPLAISIDNFIDAHRTDPIIIEIGKLAIARSILEAESRSLLRLDPHKGKDKLNFNGLGKTWFNSFFQILTENCHKDDLTARFACVAIVCFNYDRCIEHYLYLALQNYYGMSAKDSAEILATLEIFHPYGIVGHLPWQGVAVGGIDFGSEPTTKQLIDLSRELRTFTEGSDDRTTDITRIRNILATAERIAFLGFAFHRLNVELLFPKPITEVLERKRVAAFTTNVGISSSDGKVIAQELYELANLELADIAIPNSITCSDLFAEYRRSLSFSS
jgi:hypothetical protein